MNKNKKLLEVDCEKVIALFFNGCDVNTICDQFTITPHQLVELCNRSVGTEIKIGKIKSGLNIDFLIQLNSELQRKNTSLKNENNRLKKKVDLISKLEKSLKKLYQDENGI
ncbi:hypothetical protein [Thorsellia anophelis]|uniref:Uncharacterized protein n=1 Tax=Thorsellia anophelis DSM 18579 TaxID=1123402 RepID=A0A1H9Z7B6_9GAMM|nr:hypothetical protein [Thorsellia anophelis]SES76950.1 hypothetical protein SAMN02583745_00438 [Thorsellia anophelis DSM 18579]